MDQFPCDVTLDVMDLDSTIGSHPIVTNVKTPNQITEIFDTITYDKGSAIIRMLEDFVGVENFRTAVTSYLKAHAYGNTEVSDLLYHISKVVPNLNVSGIMDTWLRQRGYPVINVLRIDDKFYRLTQERFLVDSKEDPQKSPYK
jgi:glutamyl aminopeptidase